MARFEDTIRGFSSPSRYMQGPNILYRLDEFTERYGNRIQIIVDPVVLEVVQDIVAQRYDSSAHVEICLFNGECSRTEIKRQCDIASSLSAEVVIGVGGGKTLDAAKAVARESNLPVIICPTTASSDAPCSSTAIIYTDEGQHDEVLKYKVNPEIILVDSAIIACSPARFLSAGMGDALATWFEARANFRSDSANYVFGGRKRGARSTCTGRLIAKACMEVLFREGRRALRDIKAGALTPALEHVIEANILMSGVGFENTGCAGAHAIERGLNHVPEARRSLHGERVAFGLLCQLVMENEDDAIFEKVLTFFHDVDLPITLAQLGTPASFSTIHTIAEESMPAFWDNMPFHVTLDMVTASIIAANTAGAQFLERYKG